MELSTSESRKASASSDSTTTKKHTLHKLTHCGMWPRTSHACRWMRHGAPRPLPRDERRGHVVTCMNTQSLECHAYCNTSTCTCDYLRSHTPFSCVLLLPPPPVTFLLSNTRASLKLTSPESSDSSPVGSKSGGSDDRWVTGVRDSRLRFLNRGSAR